MKGVDTRGERRIPRVFFARSPDDVAPALLGKILLHRSSAGILSGRIIETEAYLGLDDPASHAYSGKTAANDVLFGPPGYTHVSLILDSITASTSRLI
jgi:DNA-3-methyladenine glycosylase